MSIDKTKLKDVELAGNWDRLFNRKKWKRWQKFLEVERLNDMLECFEKVDHKAFHPQDFCYFARVKYYSCATSSWQTMTTGLHMSDNALVREIDEKMMTQSEDPNSITEVRKYMIPTRYVDGCTLEYKGKLHQLKRARETGNEDSVKLNPLGEESNPL